MEITNTSASLGNILTLATLALPDAYVYPAFLFGTITYVIIVFCNVLVFTTIVLSKKLHSKPMFILLFNLPISDMLGATAFFPQFLMSIVTRRRLISHSACITQAFLIHFYGTGNLLILSAMAYDRYIAICCPLRYNSIMGPQKIIQMIFSVWFISFAVIFVLFMLLVRLTICRVNIVDMFCNNPSLLKLVCEDIGVNNLYGMFWIVLLQGGSLSVVMYTYVQILRTCLITKKGDVLKKAIQTCGTHLVVFLILQINTVLTLIAHRTDSMPPYVRRALGVSILIFPPILDPIVYGLKITELKQGIQLFLKTIFGSTK